MNWCRDVEDKIAILGFNVIAKKYLALNWMVIKKKHPVFIGEFRRVFNAIHQMMSFSIS